MYGAHWSGCNHIFGETTAVGVSKSKSDYDYKYKTNFQIWKENKEFERQNSSSSRPPLDLTPVGKKMTDSKYHLSTQLLLVQKRQTPTH